MIWHCVQKVELLVYLSAANIMATMNMVNTPNTEPMIISVFFITPTQSSHFYQSLQSIAPSTSSLLSRLEPCLKLEQFIPFI